MNGEAVVVGIKEKQATALRFAAEGAVARDLRLRVVHCLDAHTPADFLNAPFDAVPPVSWQAAGEGVLDDARQFIDDMDGRPNGDYVLVDAPPFETLRDESVNAAILVLGVDAAKRFGPIFGGNVTRRLINHAAVPVAVVPERAWPDELSGPIFVAIDAQSPASGPLRFAFLEASRSGRELHVAHVVPTRDMFYRSEAHHVDVSEVVDGWCEEFPEVSTKRRLFYDQAGEGCVRASEEASLLVLGRHKSRIFGHPVLSEIAKRVQCPSVVVPDEWEAD